MLLSSGGLPVRMIGNRTEDATGRPPCRLRQYGTPTILVQTGRKRYAKHRNTSLMRG